MLLGFKRRFAPMVKDGSKRHTIRGKRKRPPKVGETCHCYVDPRQKTMALLGRWKCCRVDDVRIHVHFHERVPVDLHIWINDEELTLSEMNRLCWQDGFRDRDESEAWISFSEFWGTTHKVPSTPGFIDFAGDVIYWDYEHTIQTLRSKRGSRIGSINNKQPQEMIA